MTASMTYVRSLSRSSMFRNALLYKISRPSSHLKLRRADLALPETEGSAFVPEPMPLAL